MEPIWLWLLSHLIFYGDLVGDPIHQAWFGRDELRSMECERLTQAEAHDRYPAAIPAPSSRFRTIIEIDALACHHTWLEPGTRLARDEAILHRLDSEIDELVGLATKELEGSPTWVVDAFYPSQVMTRKIASAARVEIAERGFTVSEQAPFLSAGDIEVLRSLPMRRGLPHACKRMSDSGVLEGGPLGDDVAFLAVALVHAKESQLHAGICRNGEFKWVR